MVMNIEQRLEQSAKSIEQSSQKAHDFAEKDTTIQTCAGSRDSLPKVSRIWQENFARQLNKHATEFQDRFALSQQSLLWQAGITISDSLQRYHIGVQGEEGYKEFLPNPVKLPFETAATLADDLIQERWLENGVPNKHWIESKVASALEKSLGVNARIWPKDRDLVVGDVIPSAQETADGLPITHVIVDGNAYFLSQIISGTVNDVVYRGGGDPSEIIIDNHSIFVGKAINQNSVQVSKFRLAPDIDWSNAIIRAMYQGTGVIEFDLLPNGEKYEHAASIDFYCDITGAGTVLYAGSGDAYTPKRSINISSVRFESAGNDQKLFNITTSIGVKFMNGAEVAFGNYNIYVDGVTSQLSIDDGVQISYARTDNVKIIQCKRSSISYNAFIYGAEGWGVNIDSSTAVLPDQQHGLVILAQIWGNKLGGVRCIGRNTSGDKSDWVQHPVIGGHIDHNQDDDNPSLISNGIYMRYVMRPILCADMIRAHRGAGMDIDYVEFPVIANKAYWKNSKDFEIGSNVVRPQIMPYSGDFNGTNAVESDTIEYGRSLRTFGNATIGGGEINFGSLGKLKQFLSGNGAGNLSLDLNSIANNRTISMKNGTKKDIKLLVDGFFGCRVFDGVPSGSISKRFPIYDENGNYIGEVPVYK
ncbi:hypothetical protein [Vibrio mimicus]|uniref:hypothetical protein n=1 Tax=Vibrio mimicus TaxID=674 RepID=UPI0001BADE19|nr:hypothetical protein [Vibrio mimicus]EEY36221.1 type V secretory pathway adhesin AidA [Vibrio mimicus MB451]